MEKIASFTVDHIRLVPGVYVSRKDTVNSSVITTFDIRMTSPNDEPVMNTAEVHTIEHLGATFLRNHADYKDRVIYFGPMGCRTGFYLLLAGDYSSADIVPLLKEMYTFIASYEGEIPGASAKDCGNYLDMNLPMAKYLARRFLTNVLTDIHDSQLYYPNNQDIKKEEEPGTADCTPETSSSFSPFCTSFSPLCFPEHFLLLSSGIYCPMPIEISAESAPEHLLSDEPVSLIFSLFSKHAQKPLEKSPLSPDASGRRPSRSYSIPADRYLCICFPYTPCSLQCGRGTFPQHS